MKDSEFIELLNLYLDHEIAAEDAVRLEAEVQNNPARRRVYQEYCRMQKACKVLAQDFAGDTEAPEEKVIAFEQARASVHSRSAARYVSAGLMAAAACVAFVFVSHRRAATPSDLADAPIAQTVAPAKTVAPQAVAVSQPATSTARPTNSLSIRNRETNGNLMLTAAQNDPHFAWMQDMRLTPLQVSTNAESLHLEGANGVRLEDRTFSSGIKPLPSEVQPIAIRFQR
jgi:hypothetical protein